MLRGLAVMLTDVALPAVSAPWAPASDISAVDPDVLRLVANMVLNNAGERCLLTFIKR